MKKTTLLFLLLSQITYAQLPALYTKLVQKADSLYQSGNYQASAFTYSEAFKANGWKATSTDRYNAACSWALAHVPDSAFFHLYRISTLMNYTNIGHISTDPDLDVLHNDKRWEPLLKIIRANKEKAEANLNKPLAKQLDSIYINDQETRKQMLVIEKKHGWESKEMKELIPKMMIQDSINLMLVKGILDKYGWLGADEVGEQGNSALFLVIQHADQGTQEKYLPMMREAVKKKKAKGSSLALLEDRVALGQGRRQIYGSQIGRDPETSLYYVEPLDDPEHVDQRRLEVGLPPLAEYVSNWQLKWDPVQYKKDLPALELKIKSREQQ